MNEHAYDPRACHPVRREVQDRVRQNSQELARFANSNTADFLEVTLIDKFTAFWSTYAPNERPFALYHLVKDLLSLSRIPIATFYLSLEAWTESLAASQAEAAEVLMYAFADEAYEAYRWACEESDTPPWPLEYLPRYPDGTRYSQLRAELYAKLLDEFQVNLVGACDPVSHSWKLQESKGPDGIEYRSAFCRVFKLPEPGTTINDRYTLEDVLGVGGMGVVYRMWHAHGYGGAVKLLRPGCTFRDRFVKEGRTAVEVPDPHYFIPVKETNLGDGDNPLCYTMDCVEGGRSMQHLIDGRVANDILEGVRQQLNLRGPLASPPPWWRLVFDLTPLRSAANSTKYSHSTTRVPDRLLASIVRKVAMAVDLLHTAEQRDGFRKKSGYIHSDLKPSNILLSPENGPLVADLGLCRELDAQMRAADPDALATINYITPEQARREDLTPKTDIYQLGAVLYAGITGKPPHSRTVAERSDRNVLGRVQRGEYDCIHQIAPRCSKELVAIAEKAMAIDPDDRYDSGDKLAADLKRFLDREPVWARVGHHRRRRIAAILQELTLKRLLATAALVSVVLLLLLSHINRESTETISGVLASQPRYRLTEPFAVDVLPDLTDETIWTTPRYDDVTIFQSSVLMDLSDWQPIPVDPRSVETPSVQVQNAGKIEPAYYTRVVTLRKRDNVGALGSDFWVRFQYRSGGHDVELRCLNHPYKIVGPRERLAIGDGIVLREIAVNLRKLPPGEMTDVVIQGVIWNGFQENFGKPPAERTQWASFLVPDTANLPEGELAIVFPPGVRPPRALKANCRRYFESTETEPIDTDEHPIIGRPGENHWVWRPRVKKGYHIYYLQFPWAPSQW